MIKRNNCDILEIMNSADKKDLCAECDGVYISHGISYASGLIDYVMSPVEKIFGFLSRRMDPLFVTPFSLAIPALLKTLKFINLANISAEAGSSDSLRVKCLWEEAGKRGIRMMRINLFGRNTEWFVSEYDGKMISFDSLPRPAGKASKALMWMDNKAVVRKRLAAAGIPIARGGVRASYISALRLFRRLEKPVVTKPHLGSQARHTAVHINTEEEFKRGFSSSRVLSPWVVIEEELRGTVFRGTIIGGKVAGVMRRDPPHVIGDGERTISELVEIENKNPGRNGMIEDSIFHPIALDEIADQFMKSRGYDRHYVPRKGEYVLIGEKFAKARGSSRSEVTEITHPENIKLLGKIYELIQDPIIGVDFIVEDISKPWYEQPRSGVIELNAVPFIDLHHYVLFGEPKNVAGAIWDLIFPQSKKQAL